MPSRSLARLTTLGVVALLCTVAGCGARDRVRRLVGADTGAAAASPADSLAALRAEVELLRAASAERDTLLEQVRETQDFIDSVGVGLAALAGPDPAGVRVVADDSAESALSVRALTRRRLEQVAERLARSEREARARAERVRELAGRNEALGRRVAELDASVARFRDIVQGQQGQIETLLARVDTLERENASLVAERGALTDSVRRLVARADSVFMIAASRAELLRLGAAVEEGGTRLPLVGRVSTALVPARAARAGVFSALDRRRDLVIPLPDPGRAYRIVSAHDPALLEPAQPGNPIVRGAIRVADPERFWGQSRYLVLVEER